MNGSCVEDNPHCAEWGWWSNGKWMDKNSKGCRKVCKRCEDGYYLDSNGQCQVITIENCQYANPDGSCSMCKSGYVIVNGSCVEDNAHCAEWGWWSNGKWMDKNSKGCRRVCKRC